MSRPNIPRGGAVRLRPAYTMVELTVSAAMTTVLIGAIGSALMISSYALPSRQSVFAQTTSAAPAMEQIAADLQYAVHVPQRTANAITVIVPDRDGDGHNERIEYLWSGTAGTPLQRRYNGGTVVNLLPRTSDFQLGYQTTSVPETYPGPPVEDAADSVLYEFNETAATTSLAIGPSSYAAQVFTPATPSTATLWRATEIRLHAVHRAALAGASIQLFAVDDAGLPTGSALWSTSYFGNAGSAGWTSANFAPAAAKLRTGASYCMVVKGTTGPVCDLSVQPEKSDGLMTTSDSGANWNVRDRGTMLCSVRGRITQPDGERSISRQHLSRIRIGLQTGGEATTRLETAAWTLNAPELLAAYWTASFWEGDPTTQDHNGDGVVDWVTANGTALDAATDIDEGTWTPSVDLVTNPPHAFVGNTTIDLSLRDTSAASGRAHFSVNLENNGAQAAPISVFATLRDDGTQTLEIYNSDTVVMKQSGVTITIDGVALPPALLRLAVPLHPLAATLPIWVALQRSGGTSFFSGTQTQTQLSVGGPLATTAIAEPLVRISDLPAKPIDVRLIANTADDDLVVFIGGQHYGTYDYRLFTMAGPIDRALVGGNTTAEYQYVRIRVSP